jgi:hypothetical protein
MLCVAASQELNIPRYKIIVQVVLGETKDQGVRVASKCLWDADSDNYASYAYRNVSARCCDGRLCGNVHTDARALSFTHSHSHKPHCAWLAPC